MKKDYQKDTTTGAVEVPLPHAVSVTMAELADSLREGLLALAVGAGLQVMDALIDASVTALAGPSSATTRTAAPCATAPRRDRWHSSDAGCPSAGLGCAAPTDRAR